MMTLTIDSSDFKHLPAKSSYNHNYYEYIGNCDDVRVTEMLDVYDEKKHYFYLVPKSGPVVFLGTGNVRFSLGKIIKIDFRKQ
jgi:hypothetical protein